MIFLIVSFFAVLAYAGFNFFVTSHVEEVVDRAGVSPSGVTGGMSGLACEKARERYDRLVDNQPADGNFAARDRKIDAALAEIDRSCG